MRYIVPIILIAPALASAQPQTRPSTCDVTIVRAPDDVRPVVQKWIDAEPRCRGSLEVRIIATDGGYYLIARDERGHTNERIVPDAQSAGVLIASWAADDGSVGGTPAATPAPAPMEAPMEAPMPAPPMTPMAAPPMAAPGISAPGATPMFERPLGVDAQPARAATAPRWLTLGALAGSSLGGARVDLDLKRGRWWAVGVAGSMTVAEQRLYDYQSDGTLDMFDAKGLVYAAATLRRGAFELRGAFGLGLAYTKVDATWSSPSYPPSPSYGGDGVFGIGDLSLVLGYQLNDRWGLAAGPVMTIYNQAFDLTNSSMSTPTTFQRAVDLSLFMAMRHTL